MQGGLRRGLHIDDDDGPEKYQYGGTYSLIKALRPTEKKETPKKILMPCSLEEDQDLDVEELTRKNNSLVKINPKYNLQKLNLPKALMLIDQVAAQ